MGLQISKAADELSDILQNNWVIFGQQADGETVNWPALEIETNISFIRLSVVIHY